MFADVNDKENVIVFIGTSLQLFYLWDSIVVDIFLLCDLIVIVVFFFLVHD